jgi:hypothetical protein
MTAALLLLAGFAATPPEQKPPFQPGPPVDTFEPNPAWKPLGPALWFDPAQKRLLLRARVVLREGYLEHLLCLNQSKEHESILATAAPPRLIHAGLLLTGAEVGRPVQYEPEFKPPTGTPIRIELDWKGPDGKARHAQARTWVKDEKSGKTLAQNWVFAGSQLFEEKDRTLYAADGGDLITVANFMSAILDLPFASSANDASRSFVANTEAIPSEGTYVTMTLRPAIPVPAEAKPAAR